MKTSKVSVCKVGRVKKIERGLLGLMRTVVYEWEEGYKLVRSKRKVIGGERRYELVVNGEEVRGKIEEVKSEGELFIGAGRSLMLVYDKPWKVGKRIKRRALMKIESKINRWLAEEQEEEVLTLPVEEAEDVN